MMKIHDLYSEIIGELEEYAIRVKNSRMKYISWKTTQHLKLGYKTYGLKTSEIKDQIKKHTHKFNQLNLKEKFDLGRTFFESG